MKRYFTTLSMTLLVVTALYSQTPRLVLFEEFTSASCSWCAYFNPGFNTLLNANSAVCTSIKYQSNFGFDPMYNHNKVDVNNRVSYYAVPGYPDAVMDGNVFHGSPGSVTQGMITTESAVASPFELTINQQLSPGGDSIYVTMLGKATAAVSGSLFAHCVVIEKHIHFATAPGTNGEKDFYNVMKKMLPSANGTALPTSFQTGDYFLLRYSWKLENVYDNAELSAVGFIQNTQTKALLQAANTTSTPITGVYPNDLTLQNPGNLLASYCEPSLEPTFEIQNNGSNQLISAEIKYRVNNEPEKTYNWSGSLGFLQKTIVTLPVTAFTVQSANALKIYGVQTNGGSDGYQKNDTITYSFPAAMVTPTQLKLYIKTDNNPEETTWDIKDMQGNTIESGGPYAKANFGYSVTLNLPAFNCYEFTMHDAGGNGLTNGSGAFFSFYYTAGSNVIILTGTNFGSTAASQFTTFSGVAVEQTPAAEAFTVFPNPVSGKATVSFMHTTNDPITLLVYNLQGKQVINLPAQAYSSGKQNIDVDCSKLAPGFYTVRVTSGSQFYSKKITVSK